MGHYSYDYQCQHSFIYLLLELCQTVNSLPTELSITVRCTCAVYGLRLGGALSFQGVGVGSNLNVTRCIFDSNESPTGAAAYFAQLHSGSAHGVPAVYISDTVFINGQSSGSGGAVAVSNLQSNLYNCSFINNHAYDYGT